MIENFPELLFIQWKSTYLSEMSKGISNSIATKNAWEHVKESGWVKENGKWINRSFQNLSMFITKTATNGGLRRWMAVNSDTLPDLYGESMSIELYTRMLAYIKNKTPPPAPFKSMICSDFWCGGELPYMSIAHYPDQNGKAVPGAVTELFIDGNQLKAKGVLFESRLGNAVWKSLKKDEEKLLDEDRIRISIAFLDLAHKHGNSGKVWERKSSTLKCPECSTGVGNKVYVDGYLVHLALTRVPVNTRTLMQAEKI